MSKLFYTLLSFLLAQCGSIHANSNEINTSNSSTIPDGQKLQVRTNETTKALSYKQIGLISMFGLMILGLFRYMNPLNYVSYKTLFIISFVVLLLIAPFWTTSMMLYVFEFIFSAIAHFMNYVTMSLISFFNKTIS